MEENTKNTWDIIDSTLYFTVFKRLSGKSAKPSETFELFLKISRSFVKRLSHMKVFVFNNPLFTVVHIRDPK